MILRFLFYAFLFYLFYKLLFNFIIPVYKTTRKLKKGFREMQEQMRQHTGQPNHQPSKTANDTNKKEGGEYIEFEDVK